MSGPVSSSIRIENPLTQPDWNARLQTHPHSTLFHTREWASVLQQSYGFTPMYVTARRDDQIVSLFPLMEVNSPLTGRRGVSLPFTDHCEPLTFLPEAASISFAELVEYGRGRKWKYLEARGMTPEKDWPGTPRPSLSFFTHELDLSASLDHLRVNLNSSTERSLRKAEKANLTIEVSTDKSALRNFYSLHCQTRQQHGLPPQPFRFFQSIQKEILDRNLGVIVSARDSARTIASAIFFRFGKNVIYKFGASDRACQHLRANNLVMWSAIQWCVQQGANQLHFGRTSRQNDGLRRFKLGWGSEEKVLNYFKYDLGRKEFITDHDDTTGWHTQVFQRLPLFLSRWIGTILYKHIA